MKSMPWCRPEPWRGRRRTISLAAAALLTALGCSGEPPEAGPDAVASDTTAPDTAAPETPGAPVRTATPLDPADTASWSIGITSAPSTVTAAPLPVLTALRAGTHPEYERVTFEIAGAPGGGDTAGAPATDTAGGVPAGRPGYELEYVDRPLIACGSGDQIFPVGDGWLEIRLEPAAAHTEAGQPTLGPREVDVNGPLLQRIYRTCDFEGIVTHVLALGSPNEYRVFTLADPLRIVVDVRVAGR